MSTHPDELNPNNIQLRKAWIAGSFEKGEIDNGAKAMGNTGSGKSVYPNHPASHDAYKDFSKQDHHDAAVLHDQKSNYYTTSKKGGNELANHHAALSNDHFKRSTKEYNSDVPKKFRKAWDADAAFDKLMKGGAGSGPHDLTGKRVTVKSFTGIPTHGTVKKHYLPSNRVHVNYDGGGDGTYHAHEVKVHSDEKNDTKLDGGQPRESENPNRVERD